MNLRDDGTNTISDPWRGVSFRTRCSACGRLHRPGRILAFDPIRQSCSTGAK